MEKFIKLLPLLTITLFLPQVLCSQQDLPADQIYDIVNNSVVVVVAYDKFGNIDQGSGVVINKEGYIATNYHVCQDAVSIEIDHYDRKIKNIEIIKTDTNKDVMILKVRDNTFSPIISGSTTDLRPGQTVYAIGSPEGYENSISQGIISGFRHDENGIALIQMTTPITDGSSGGAVVNTRGQLIGLSTSGQHEGNIYFAIPVEDIIDMLDSSSMIAVNNEPVNYLQEGSNANKRKNYQDAVFYFSKYLENNFSDIQAYFARGYAHLKLKEYKLAISDLTKTITDTTSNFEPFFYRGNCFYTLGEYKKAIDDYTRGIQIAPQYAELYYNRGYAFYKLEVYDKSIVDWQRCIELNHDYGKELNDKIKECMELK
jgi:tetratricopeptide (TPR) repeat protein